MLADHVGGQRIQKPALKAALPHAHITRFLVQHGWQDAVANHRAVERIQICRAGAFSIALDSPGKAHIVVHALVVAGHQKCPGKSHWIDGRAKGQTKLLAAGQRYHIGAIRNVERRNNPQHPLLLLFFKLLLGKLIFTLARFLC